MNLVESYIGLIHEGIMFVNVVNSEEDAIHNMDRVARLICELREIEEDRDEG